jgi:hypothetical protein
MPVGCDARHLGQQQLALRIIEIFQAPVTPFAPFPCKLSAAVVLEGIRQPIPGPASVSSLPHATPLGAARQKAGNRLTAVPGVA